MFAMDGQYLNLVDINVFFDDVKKYIKEIINVGGLHQLILIKVVS